MASAKDLIVKPIASADARAFIRKHHYSGKVATNSQLHLGVFWDGKLEGVMQFGPSLDKSKIIGLVEGTGWNEFLELNRMAFSDALPKNSESRAISVAMKLLKKHAPHVKWVISFADGTQCGDGTIYRASGFVLTGIKKSLDLCRLPSGEVVHSVTLKSSPNTPREELGGRTFAQVTGGGTSFRKYVEAANGEVLAGFQLRYIYFIDSKSKNLLNCPELPFSAIAEAGAGMYKGEKR